jgi:hypothetical protein|tara:strand:- start:4397 stop:4594 length:198 start_codon:yes stop_codon:yes gene_type:complete
MNSDNMIRSSFDKWIRRGEAIRSHRCVNYAKMGLAAWAQGRDLDAFAYLAKAKHEYFIDNEELPF